MAKKICPICKAPLDEENDNRCCRFPVCTYQETIDKSIDEYIMYDLETSGLSRNDHIIEVGAIYVSGGKITDSFSALCNPGIFINQRIVELTGITNGMLKDKKSEAEVIDDFVRWCKEKGTKLCVGHNINRFDNKMLKAATKRYGLNYPFERTLDTMVMAQKTHMKQNGKVSSYKQEELARHYGVIYSAHRAVNDVEALFEIFQNLQKETSELPIINID